MDEDGLNLHVVHEVVDLVDLVTALAQGGDGAVGIARVGEANFCRDAHVFSSCVKRKSGPSSVTWQSESRRSRRRRWPRIARSVPTVMPSGTSARRYRAGRQPARYVGWHLMPLTASQSAHAQQHVRVEARDRAQGDQSAPRGLIWRHGDAAVVADRLHRNETGVTSAHQMLAQALISPLGLLVAVSADQAIEDLPQRER